MAGPVVLIGTGTSVGKTYVAERLLRALAARGRAAVGYKPLESGVSEGADSDIARLGRASTFHVKPPLLSLTFSAPVAPPVAARLEGRVIDLQRLHAEVQRACATEANVIVELPGGAFSPMTEATCCAEFARSLPGVRAVLIAVDRLGVLHDVTAATRACAAMGLPLAGVALSAPAEPDASTGLNVAYLRALTCVPVLASLPRQPADASVSSEDAASSLAHTLFP